MYIFQQLYYNYRYNNIQHVVNLLHVVAIFRKVFCSVLIMG